MKMGSLTNFIGTLAMGWGSGTANFPYLVTPEQAIQNYVLTQGRGEVFAILDNFAQSQINVLAAQASVALVFVNADSGEGYISVDGNEGDRKNLTVWKEGNALIKNVSALCNNTIVVMHTTGPVLVSEWYDNDNVTAIVWAGLPGQESGNSLVDVLYGAYNPGGKLPFTIGPDRASYGTDVLYEPNNGQFGAPQLDFTEGVFIDYRAFDKAGITPIYEFGFGLSYTTFSYAGLTVTPGSSAPYVPTTGQTTAAPSLGNFSTDASEYLFPNSSFSHIPLYIYPYLNSTDLAAESADPDYGQPSNNYLPPGSADGSPQPLLPAGGAPGGNPGLYDVLYEVSATITNTGDVIGDEVAQLYVSLGEGEPAVVLRGFDRITIAAGASATFTATLTRRDLSTWDTASQNWVMSTCPTVYVGSSSRNLPLSASLGSCGSTPSSSASSGYGQATSAVSQISNGQPQAPTGPPVVSQISDGQPQAPTSTVVPVTTISDGQPQAPTATTNAVSQISDGQPQATTT
jgi:beta-glucosidase